VQSGFFLPAAARAAAIAACILVVLFAGCSKKSKALDEIEEAYQRADYEETMALCKYAIRRQWDTAPVYFYYGAALVSLGRDYEGFNRLEEGISKDLSLAGRSGQFLYQTALDDVSRGDRKTAARRMQKAVEYDPSIDLGPYRFLVADVYFEQKNYGRAAPIYRDAIAAYPDTSILETAYFNMATSYDEMDWNAQAREAYEELLNLFPRGEYRSESEWRLANLMYENAEKQHVLGNYEDAVGTLTSLIEQTDNRGMLQKSYFLLGETYEAMEDYRSAYQSYREVIAVDRGASGRIVERAREKIAALQEAGFN
jgi:tetratricopeptide (TPR) repeat protein